MSDQTEEKSPSCSASSLERFVMRFLKVILFIPAGVYEFLILAVAFVAVIFIGKFWGKATLFGGLIIDHAKRLPDFDWYFT